jgi:hypothetical protein
LHYFRDAGAKKCSRWPTRLARAATISGILESVLALGALVEWYSIYVTFTAKAINQSALPGGGNDRIGMFGYVWFWLNSVTWIVGYFGLEGVTRSLAALVTGEAYGTLPLCAVDYLFRRAIRPRPKPELQLVADEISPGEATTSDLKIPSCRAKPDWNYPFTVRYAGAYFQVVANVNPRGGSAAICLFAASAASRRNRSRTEGISPRRHPDCYPTTRACREVTGYPLIHVGRACDIRRRKIRSPRRLANSSFALRISVFRVLS